MQLITITISLLIHSNPTATVFTKLYICLYEVKRLSHTPKNLVIIHYLRRQYDETNKPNAVLMFYICCVFSTYHGWIKQATYTPSNDGDAGQPRGRRLPAVEQSSSLESPSSVKLNYRWVKCEVTCILPPRRFAPCTLPPPPRGVSREWGVALYGAYAADVNLDSSALKDTAIGHSWLAIVSSGAHLT